MHLSELKTGDSATVLKVRGHGGFRRRILEMGFVRGAKVTVLLNAPLKDPIEYEILGYKVSLRRSEADMVKIITNEEAEQRLKSIEVTSLDSNESIESIITRRSRHINVALIGNPNAGKTSLFNALTGSEEHVGNYSGVTIDAKSSKFTYNGYEFHVTDLPGTYALSAYSPEERYVRQHIEKEMPDVLLNVVCASNLHRNLFLTTELIDMSQKMVVALNMYDEFEKSGAQLDYNNLGSMIGCPMIPVVAKNHRGINELLDTVIAVYENADERVRHIHINQGVLEESVENISNILREHRTELPKSFPPRYYSMKLLEGDQEIQNLLKQCPSYNLFEQATQKELQHLNFDLGKDSDIESAFADQKYGFISGALRETYVEGKSSREEISLSIDRIVTNPIVGYPIFILMMGLTFFSTFVIGKYPQQGLELLIEYLGELVSGLLPHGILKDLIMDGIIGGVGSVIVFLPNIMILYFFISFFEDSGYLARAAFIMDRLMHMCGLHGKSFIPLIMGFGCNVPAIMATRTIESKSSRIITMLITPFMSCSARLPIFMLIIGIFFDAYTGTAITMLYLLGVFAAILTARILRVVFFKKDETPFVMELPPYRVPTLNAIVSHMWEKCAQYLKKMGGLILVSSIIIWALSYFPLSSQENDPERRTNSYAVSIGKFIEPMFKPLGLNWKASVSVLSGVAAKEIMVSSLGVIYNADNESETDHKSLSEEIRKSNDFTPASAIAFLIFTLLYFPCIATLFAIRNESNWKWSVFTAIYNTTFAWMAAFIVYRIILLFI